MSLIKVALDHCLSPKLVPVLQALYGNQGYRFMHVEEIAVGPTKDAIWADTYRRYGGKFVLSGDCKIAYRPHEAIAFIENGLVCAFPSENWASLKIHTQATALPHYWPAIVKTFAEAEAGTCWRLPLSVKDRVLTLNDVELEPLEIPAHVLEEARARWLANRAPQKADLKSKRSADDRQHVGRLMSDKKTGMT